MRRPRHDLLASTLLMSALGAPAASQVLDLDAAPPLPRLETSVLEILGREHRPDGKDVVSQVDSTLARLTIELASKGLLEGTAAPSAALAAIRLAEEKDRIVAALRPLRDPNAFTGSPPRILGDVDRRNATDLLVRFSDRGLDVLRRGSIGSHREFSEAMTETFQPLLDAVVIIDRTPARSPWPSSDPGHPSSMTSIRPDERSADDIESWGRSLESNHSLHHHVKNVLDRPGEQPIDPASAFPQDLPDLVILRNAWEIDRSGIAAITASVEHDEYGDRLEEILDWHSDIASRRALLAWIDIVDHSRRMNDLQLDQIPAEARSAARRVGRNHRTLVRRALDTWKEATATENRMLDGDVLPVFAALRESTGDVDR
ncbi:MAG: hypothetical protein GY895_20280, partial [Phycisphaera sp.]|nr:hypothetical protein [Phycisphaera sp.]